jgi:putative membrane protein
VRLLQGPLQRKLGLATVHLDAAGRRVRAEFRERRQEEARSLVTELAALSRTARKMAAHTTPLVPARPAVPAEMPASGDGDQAASVAPPVNASQSEA